MKIFSIQDAEIYSYYGLILDKKRVPLNIYSKRTYQKKKI